MTCRLPHTVKHTTGTTKTQAGCRRRIGPRRHDCFAPPTVSRCVALFWRHYSTLRSLHTTCRLPYKTCTTTVEAQDHNRQGVQTHSHTRTVNTQTRCKAQQQSQRCVHYRTIPSGTLNVPMVATYLISLLDWQLI